MRSKLQQRKLSPLLVLDEADATLRTVDRTQVCTCMLDMLHVVNSDFDHTQGELLHYAKLSQQFAGRNPNVSF